MLRLTAARATGLLGPEADGLIDRVSREMTAAGARGGIRGAARLAVTDRLAGLDAELIGIAREALSEADRRTLEREAADELAPFRDRMTEVVYRRAHGAAIDRLVRERFGLPTLRIAP
jgi:hypothetical protein